MRLIEMLIFASWLLPQPLTLAIGQDSLLDSTSREGKRRGEVRLFTNHELSRLKNARVSVLEGSIRNSGKEKSEKPEQVEGEDDWPSKLRSTKGRLSASVNRLHVLQLKHNHLRNLYFNASNEVHRLRFEEELRRLLEELKLAELEEKNAREAWQVLRANAAKAGLSAGKEPAVAVSIGDMEATNRP